jgi:hypothetical protein
LSSALSAAATLLERHFTAVVRGLVGRVDQAMQIDRGLEGRLVVSPSRIARANSVYI